MTWDEEEELFMGTFVSVKDLIDCVDECRDEATKEDIDPSTAWESFVECVKECKRTHALS